MRITIGNCKVGKKEGACRYTLNTHSKAFSIDFLWRHAEERATVFALPVALALCGRPVARAIS